MMSKKLQQLSLLLMSGLLLVGFFSCQSDAHSNNATAATPELKIDYEKFTLDNGLDVILHEDKSDPIVSVAIMYHVGSNREKPGRTGFAHFFEHMLFQNSENVGKGNFFKKIEELGGTLNGGTWNDGTVYYEVVPKDALEKILWMESDRMGFVINTVTTPVLENEKQIVKNEKRQRVDNQPYGHTGYVVDKTLYPEAHPYNWQVIGSLEDLQAATIDDVKEFYNKWYGANNATLVIAGDFDNAQTKEWVKKYFSELPKGDEIAAIQPQASDLKETVKLMHEDNFAQLPELRMVYPTVADGHEDAYALDYLGQLMSQGKRAPLYKELVENKKLAPAPASSNRTREIAGQFVVRVRANNDVDLDSIATGIQTAFANFEANGIDDKDMQKIKNKLETDFYGSISSILGKSFQLAQFNEFRGSPDELSAEIKKILAVSKEDVMRVYNKYIKDQPHLITSFVPKGKPELAVEGSAVAEVVEEAIVAGAEDAPQEEVEEEFERTPSAFDRSIEPELGAAPLVSVPTIWSNTLVNGLKVYGIENEELPLVEFSLRLKGGMLFDDPAKVGVANLMTDIMQEGTANKTPEELQDAIGALGADINMSTSSEYITINASCLARNFAATLDLVEEMLLQPRWDAQEFERIKKQTITQIQQRSGQPNAVAVKVFNKLLYGEDNILANNTLGTIETVQTITLDDLKNYYNQYYSPNVSNIHIVGAVGESMVMSELKSLGDNWENKNVEVPTFTAPAAKEKPMVYFVDIPDSKQSVIRIGKPMMDGNDKDYYASSIVNERLGGGGSARLFQQLREEKGYTYGAYSGIPRRINDSYFTAFASVRSNVTKESVELFKEILDGYQKDYSEEDLSITKNTLIKQNALAFETLNDKMSVLQNISTFDLPMDYIKQQEKVVEGMTLDGAKSLIGNYLNPEKMIYVVVGDAKTQAENLEKVGLGKPIMVDKDGVLVNQVAN